jgi:Type II secretion system (T2SS), protein E, N-terminal domain
MMRHYRKSSDAGGYVADDAGALLVRSGLITTEALELARALVQSEGGSLGEHLVASRVLSDDALTEFYRTRLLVPQVNPNTLARLPESVVASIPAELAIEMRVIPVALGEGITIAMGDPSSRLAVDEVSAVTGTYVIRSVATQMQIAWCLAHYYGHVTALGQRLVQAGATGAGGEPVPPPSAPPRRARGLTSKVNASRHRALPPITSQVQILRPDSAVLDDPTRVIEINADEPSEPIAQFPRGNRQSAELTDEQDDGARDTLLDDDDEAEISIEAEPASDDEDEDAAIAAPVAAPVAGPLAAARVRTLTGEIAISTQRKAEVVRHVEREPEPASTIEISEELKPKRRAANWQDPPELATRTGELRPRPPSQRSHLEEPAVVIAEEAFDELALAKAKANRLAQLNASVEVKVEADVAIVTSQPAHGVVAQPADDSDSAPILLQPKRPSLEMPAARPPLPSSIPSSRPSAKPAASSAKPAASSAKPAASSAKPAAAVPKAVEADEHSGVVLLGQPKVSSRPSMPPPAAQPQPAAPQPAKSPANAPVVAKSPTGPGAGQRRPEKRTQLGLGIDAVKSATSETMVPLSSSSPSTSASTSPSGRASRDTEVTLPPEMSEALAEETVAQLRQSAQQAAAAMAAPVSPDRPAQRAAARASSSDIDDGWGPPGSTIPPPWLGSIPGGIDVDYASGIPGAVIPISDESGPLLLTPPSPPQARRTGGMPAPNTEDLVAELELATGRVVELVRRLDQAVDRDQIIDLLVQHLAESHQRAGFLTVRQAVLTAFRITPAPATMSTASLKLDGPSTLQDVMDTQLPYRGPIADDSSRQFLGAILGEVPSEILLVPITVRERAVGVLFAERRKRHTFDEQLAVASRAAGVAFERVVRARRGGTSS